MEEEEEEDDYNIYLCKIVLVGDNFGKKNIISSLIDNTLEDDMKSKGMSSFFEKTFKFDGKMVNFGIWDTEGREKYSYLGKLFYKDANAVILVYDAANRQSFEEIQQYLYNQVKEYAPRNIS